MRSDSRGQSETIGVVLLTAVFVVLSLTVGVFLLSNFDGSNRTTETVDLHSEINGQDVVIEHRGGTSYDPAKIRVVFRQETSGNLQYTLAAFSLRSAGDEGTFSPGDRWEKSVAELDGAVQLLVIDTASGELIHDGSYSVSQAGIRIRLGEKQIPVKMWLGEQLHYPVFRVSEEGATETITAAATAESFSALS